MRNNYFFIEIRKCFGYNKSQNKSGETFLLEIYHWVLGRVLNFVVILSASEKVGMLECQS
jgi:hypothetical protein